MKKFMSIKDAATYSGLSQFYIRNRCKNGTIPHRMMGKKYMVDYEEFIERTQIGSTEYCDTVCTLRGKIKWLR